MRRHKKELDTTTNRSVFNKLRKQDLEARGKIRCAWCSYHHGDNYSNNYYGEYDSGLKEFIWERVHFTVNAGRETTIEIGHPNWKLRFKGRKSWDKVRPRKLN